MGGDSPTPSTSLRAERPSSLQLRSRIHIKWFGREYRWVAPFASLYARAAANRPYSLERRGLWPLPRHSDMYPQHFSTRRLARLLQRLGNERAEDLARNVYDVCRVRKFGMGV